MVPDKTYELLTQLRIDAVQLKCELACTEKALKLAHENMKAWIGISVTVTAIIVGVIMNFIK